MEFVIKLVSYGKDFEILIIQFMALLKIFLDALYIKLEFLMTFNVISLEIHRTGMEVLNSQFLSQFARLYYLMNVLRQDKELETVIAMSPYSLGMA